eukprot:scaffold6299_cov109-Isochrysis_galbana.AAC.2
MAEQPEMGEEGRAALPPNPNLPPNEPLPPEMAEGLRASAACGGLAGWGCWGFAFHLCELPAQPAHGESAEGSQQRGRIKQRGAELAEGGGVSRGGRVSRGCPVNHLEEGGE